MKPCHTFALVASTVVSNQHFAASTSSVNWSPTTPRHDRDAFITRLHRRVRTVRERDAPLPYYFQHRKVPTSLQRRTVPIMLRVESTPQSADASSQKKKKKNKYSQFSKSDNLSLDPLDAMLVESRSKLRQISQQSKKNRKIKSVNDSLEAVEELLSSLDDDHLDQIQKLDDDEEEGKTWERNTRSFPDNKEIDPYDPTTYGYIELGEYISLGSIS